MQLYPLKLVTVVAEEILKGQITKKAVALGATGFTYHVTHGCGPRDTRHDSLSGDNVRIEFVCPQDVAEAILTMISHDFFEHYACIAWVTDVSVMRGALYAKKKT
ncbi:MAG TPA: hypothetical protein VGX78_20450 [Pirellulales bacterium]|nr:hypothetical protein [Pirellulales bacterium]